MTRSACVHPPGPQPCLLTCFTWDLGTASVLWGSPCNSARGSKKGDICWVPTETNTLVGSQAQQVSPEGIKSWLSFWIYYIDYLYFHSCPKLLLWASKHYAEHFSNSTSFNLHKIFARNRIIPTEQIRKLRLKLYCYLIHNQVCWDRGYKGHVIITKWGLESRKPSLEERMLVAFKWHLYS